jgi:uncharacterized PurR-regulated membrane protein YhhQ (DUF165 family)
MISAVIIFFPLSLFLLGMTTFAASRFLPLLAQTNAIMMVCVPLFGAATLSVFDYRVYVGDVFMAVVMYGLTLKHMLFGTKAAIDAIKYMLFSLVIVLGTVFMLQHAHALTLEYGTEAQAIGARIVTFCLVQSFFVALMDRFAALQSVYRIVFITIAMQALDSAVYYPCAFAGDVPVEELMRITLLGWATKSVVAVLSVPFLLWCQRHFAPARIADPCVICRIPGGSMRLKRMAGSYAGD